MTFSRKYHWERLWQPRETQMPSPGPHHHFDSLFRVGPRHGSDDRTFSDLEAIPCLVLLGAPGMGKTTWFELEEGDISDGIARQGEASLWLNLRSCIGEAWLQEKILKSTAFQRWQTGDYRMHLFLDSLDECLLHIPNALTWLIDELKVLPIDRLSVRILCRTAEWQWDLQERLFRLWPSSDDGKVFEIAPLTEDNINEAAQGEISNPSTFIEEVNRKGLQIFASNPQNLGFLFETYKRDGELPPDQPELFTKNLLWLCDEYNPDRRLRVTQRLDNEKRLRVASRIAFLTVFCNRNSLWIGPESSPEVGEGDLRIGEVCGIERWSLQDLNLSPDLTVETISTSLFASHGPNRMGWAHQSYGEFLAAYYMAQSFEAGSVDRLTQVMDLIVQPGDPRGRIVRQLRETASWLAMMRPDIFEGMVKFDPEVLLLRNLNFSPAGDTERRKGELTENLLRLLDEDKILDYGLATREFFSDLAHPTSAEKILPYISEGHRSLSARRVAIEIAEQNCIAEVQEAIAAVALDPTDDHLVRIVAAQALLNEGDDETKAKLKPLAKGEAGEDPDDELKGYGLLAVWPSHMTAVELFDSLTRPKEESFFGTYQIQFLHYGLLQHLRPEHLVPALGWVQRQPGHGERPLAFNDVIDSIMTRAYENLFVPGVLEEFAAAAISRLQHYEEVMRRTSDPSAPLFEDREKRLRIVEAMIALLEQKGECRGWAAWALAGLVTATDLHWLLESFNRASTHECQRLIASMISAVFRPSDQDQFEILFQAQENNVILGEELQEHFGFVPFGSPEEARLRNRHGFRVNEASNEAPARPVWDAANAVNELLDRFDQGDHYAFANFVAAAVHASAENGSEGPQDASLVNLEAWDHLGVEIQDRLLGVAFDYVSTVQPVPQEHRVTGSIYRIDVAGCEALALILHRSTDLLERLPVDVWQNWTPILLEWRIEGPVSKRVLAMAYGKVPDTFLNNVVDVIDRENIRLRDTYITRTLDDFWDDRIAAALVNKLEDSDLTPRCMGTLLAQLLEHRVNQAVSFAEELLEAPLPISGNQRDRAMVAGRELLLQLGSDRFSAVWQAIESDQEFGRQLIADLAHNTGIERAEILRRFTEPHLAKLYVWISKNLPHNERRSHGNQRIFRFSYVDYLREAILRNLQDRGTPEAVSAINELMTALPDQSDRLKWVAHAAQDVTNWLSWSPMRPSELLVLVQYSEKRLVQSADQLLKVIIESLRRFQEKLRAQSYVLENLWNTHVRGTTIAHGWPKDENHFANTIAGHLEEDLRGRQIVVNREPQIRRGGLTDIRVDAVRNGAAGSHPDHLTVIIEAKGCWHSELFTAMRDQLVNSYLIESCCKHGLYLVGWFFCTKWVRDDDSRRRSHDKKIRALTAAQAGELFNSEAQILSEEYGLTIRALVLDASLP